MWLATFLRNRERAVAGSGEKGKESWRLTGKFVVLLVERREMKTRLAGGPRSPQSINRSAVRQADKGVHSAPLDRLDPNFASFSFCCRWLNLGCRLQRNSVRGILSSVRTPGSSQNESDLLLLESVRNQPPCLVHILCLPEKKKSLRIRWTEDTG